MNFSQPVSNMEHLKKLWPIWQFLFPNEAHFRHPALAFINLTHRFVLPRYLAKIKVSFLLKTAVSWKFACVWCVLAALLTASLIFDWWLFLNFYFLDYLFYSLCTWFNLTTLFWQWNLQALWPLTASRVLLHLNFELPL